MCLTVVFVTFLGILVLRYSHRIPVDIYHCYSVRPGEVAVNAVLLQDAGSQGIGFLLGSLGVSVAMTSEACYKGLPRTQAGDVINFRGLSIFCVYLYGFVAVLMNSAGAVVKGSICWQHYIEQVTSVRLETISNAELLQNRACRTPLPYMYFPYFLTSSREENREESERMKGENEEER